MNSGTGGAGEAAALAPGEGVLARVEVRSSRGPVALRNSGCQLIRSTRQRCVLLLLSRTRPLPLPSLTVLETLLRRGADPRAPVLGCITPLTLAMLSCDKASYNALLAAGEKGHTLACAPVVC